jgi:hypothetical protein
MRGRTLDYLSSTLGPIILPDFATAGFCEALITSAVFSNSGAPKAYRTFQGLYQPTKRLAEYTLLSADDHARHCASVEQLLTSKFGLSVPIVSFEPSIIYRYPVGPGFVLHDDEVTSFERDNAQKSGVPIVAGDITTVLCLNGAEHYEGGEMVFPTFGLTMKPPAGSLIIFPATRLYPHQVNPIIAGERYTLVMRPVIRP